VASWHGLSQGVAPGCDRGGWGALCNLGIGFLVIGVVENESDKEVIWLVVSIGLAVTAALAWALTFLEQTGRIKLN
jgi:hypothetical protein